MRYLRIENWEKLQHYTERNPPWIKIYVELLDPIEKPEYAALSDLAKIHLVHVWLLASRTGGRIAEKLLTRDRLNLSGKPRLDEIVAGGFATWEDDQMPLGGASMTASDPGSTAASAGASMLSETLGSLRPTTRGEKLREVTDTLRAYARAKAPGISVDEMFQEWTNYQETRGWKTRSGPIKDYAASFRTWIDNAPKFARNGGSGKKQRTPVTGEDFSTVNR